FWCSVLRLFFPFLRRLMSLLRLTPCFTEAHLGLCSRRSVKITPGMTVCFSLFIQLAYLFFYTDDEVVHVKTTLALNLFIRLYSCLLIHSFLTLSTYF